MNYHKLDASLAAALDDVEDPDEQVLTVFIHTVEPPAPHEVEILHQLGVDAVHAGRNIQTTTLSLRGVGAVSDQGFVKSVKLSHRLKLMPDT